MCWIALCLGSGPLNLCVLMSLLSGPSGQSFKSPEHLPVFSKWRILHWRQEEGAVPNLAMVFGPLNSSWALLKTSCQLWTALYFFTLLQLSTGPYHNSFWGMMPASNKISFLIVKYRRSRGYFFGQLSHAEIQAAESSCFLAFKLAPLRLTEILLPCAATVCPDQPGKKKMWS